jgi:hypothetical protein
VGVGGTGVCVGKAGVSVTGLPGDEPQAERPRVRIKVN